MSLGKLLISKTFMENKYTIYTCRKEPPRKGSQLSKIVYKDTGEFLFLVDKSINRLNLIELIRIFNRGHIKGVRDQARTKKSTEIKNDN